MRHCPVCPETQLERVRYEGFMIFRCRGCGGALLEDPKLAKIERKMHIGEDELETQAASSAPDSATLLRCPRCRSTMSKTPALKRRPAGFRSQSVADFDIDHCKYCHLTWFDGGELAKLQLSYERSAKGRESKQHYVNYTALDPAEKAEYGRTIAASAHSTGDALFQGFMKGLVEMARRSDWTSIG